MLPEILIEENTLLSDGKIVEVFEPVTVDVIVLLDDTGKRMKFHKVHQLDHKQLSRKY